uniref:Putative secreted protein n=1 Tax=Ixodes ricinus TaxID=34613 RepID=A0A6B0TZJ3_IXORI
MLDTCSRLGWPFLAASAAPAAAATATALAALATWAPVRTTPAAPPAPSGSRSVCVCCSTPLVVTMGRANEPSLVSCRSPPFWATYWG